ncbi:MAG: LysR family transcriptional regulator, partial [Pseudomonadota bacterium]
MLTGSVSQAAANLNRTQPSVSSLISALERELSVRLFERRKGRLHPVPEAHYLLAETERVLETLDNAGRNMRRYRDGTQGLLRIVAMPGGSVQFIPSLLADYVSRFPSVRPELLSRSSDSVMRVMESQKFDLGLADYDENLDHDSGLVDSKLFSYSAWVVLPNTHRLAGRARVDLEDLDGEPLATLYKEHTFTRKIERAFVDKDLHYRPVFSVQYFISLFSYVQSGLAIAMVNPLAVETFEKMNLNASGGVSFAKLESEIAFETVFLLPRHRQLSVAAKRFSEELNAALQDLSRYN